VLSSEAAFAVCLAWHWPVHHWQSNWRVVWASSRMCVGKRRTLRATIVTTFSLAPTSGLQASNTIVMNSNFITYDGMS